MKLTFSPLLLLTFLLTGCSGFIRPALGTATPRPPTATPVLSPTPVWFPATDTPTPRPFASPTAPPDWRPGLGDPIRVDNFTDEEQWDLFQSDEGTASLFNGRLALSAAPSVYVTSLNTELTLTDYYLEVTATLNICSGTDEYGLLVRALPTRSYRFGLTCNGDVRAERIARNERLILAQPFHSGDAPRGAPAQVRFGVWVFKSELRFFLNGNYQFSVTDSNLPSGSIGFFVRSAGGNPIAVSFSDLVIQKLDYTPVTTP
jgi:hypothetical protein